MYKTLSILHKTVIGNKKGIFSSVIQLLSVNICI